MPPHGRTDPSALSALVSSAALLEALAGFDDDYVALLEEDRREQAAVQERDPL